MLDRYSDGARRVVGLAELESETMGHLHVGTEHLLLGILADGQSPAAAALDGLGATLAGARQKVVEAVGDRRPETIAGDLPLTARAKRVLERASRFSLQRRSPEIRTEHLLIAILNVDGTAGQVLRGLGVDLTALEEAVSAVPEPGPADVMAAPTLFEPESAKPAGPTEPAEPEGAHPQSPSPSVEPRCAACGAPLAGNLATQVLTTRDGDEVRVVFCARCGSALGR